MAALRHRVRSHRFYLAFFWMWVGTGALAVAGSLLYLRWAPMWLGAVWLLLTAGIILWALIGLIDRWLARAAPDQAAAAGDGSVAPGRVFRSTVALWIILTVVHCFSAFIDDGAWFVIAMAGVPIVAFWLAIVLWATALTALRLRQRAYRASLHTALVPVLGVSAFFYGQTIGDALRFALERPSYAATIAALRAGGEHDDRVEVDLGPPMVAYFPWGGMIWTSYGVVFDETDQMAKPLVLRRTAWSGRDVPPELKCEGRVLPVGGHFYLGRFAC